MTYKCLYGLCSFKRPGASLVNVCVFFLAATMITAQVFFFSTTTTETLAEEAKSVERRFSMEQKLKLAFKALQSSSIVSDPVSTEVAFSNKVGITGTVLVSFDKAARVWTNDADKIYIYNLNYTLQSLNYAGHEQVADNWDKVPIPQRIFPPMEANYFLVRVLSPGQGLGKKLMYQVLVQRDTSTSPYTIKPLTFQEVWYE